MFFTFGSSCTPRCTACDDDLRGSMLTLTFSTPGTLRAAATSALRSAGIWLLAG